MSDGSSSPSPANAPGRRAAGPTRQAALWATVVALPVALVAGLVFFRTLNDPATDPAAATPSATAPRPQATGPVQMAAPPLTARAQTVCRALLSQLPRAVRDRAQRPVTAGPEQNAAYGDPAITVACGIPTPSFPATDLVYSLDRVCWHATETAAATVWTTVDREVPVQVTVPSAYQQPGQWTNEFSAGIIATVPSLKQPPSGCAGTGTGS